MSLIEMKYLVRKKIGHLHSYFKMHKIRIRCATSCAKDYNIVRDDCGGACLI